MSYRPQDVWLTGLEKGKLGSAKAAPSVGIRHLRGHRDKPRLGWAGMGWWPMNDGVYQSNYGHGQAREWLEAACSI